jgi:DNA polymerase-3 subunit epsilon
VVLDFETTGLDTAKDSIVEACLLPVERGSILIRNQLYLQIQSDDNSFKASSIHGILPSDGIMDRRDSLMKIANYVNGKWMVGHCVGFDFLILSNHCNALNISLKVRGLIDTHQMAIKLEKTTNFSGDVVPSNYSLKSLCKKYKIPLEEEHTATGDSLATAMLFIKLINLYKKRKYRVPVTRFE